ncbi:MAG: DOPA 4,5-dioxygenase family protein [Betaproteobacteria bacterium]
MNERNAGAKGDAAEPGCAPYHAHIYFPLSKRTEAESLQAALRAKISSGEIPTLLYVGELRDRSVGPHPMPQFEIHFSEDAVQAVTSLLVAAGFTALIHPLTDDDVADHTNLAHWIGEPLELDLSVLDPPGINQGIARFAKTDV